MPRTCIVSPKLWLLPVLSLTGACGTDGLLGQSSHYAEQRRLAQVQQADAQAQNTATASVRVDAPATLDANALTYEADLSGTALDTNLWLRRDAHCSTARNACVDADAGLSQLDGNGALILRTVAAQPATDAAPATPARYPSVDLVDPRAAFLGGCVDVKLRLAQAANTYSGVVLAPASDAAFTGQFWLISANDGELRLGVGCRGDGGSVQVSRPMHGDFVAKDHAVQFCANANGAQWKVDGKIWAEVEADELPPACGAWPFVEHGSALHPHLVLTPNSAAAAPAAEMVLHRLRVGVEAQTE